MLHPQAAHIRLRRLVKRSVDLNRIEVTARDTSPRETHARVAPDRRLISNRCTTNQPGPRESGALQPRLLRFSRHHQARSPSTIRAANPPAPRRRPPSLSRRRIACQIANQVAPLRTAALNRARSPCYPEIAVALMRLRSPARSTILRTRCPNENFLQPHSSRCTPGGRGSGRRTIFRNSKNF